jgi:sugar (pentulose or hexulose) kinase
MVSRVETIHAAGGAAINREILQVMADVFGSRVFQMPVGNSAALGAALRAAHAHMLALNRSTSWVDVIAGLAEPLANSRVDPDPDRHSLYRDMVSVYAACESHALGRGPDPRQVLERFRHRAQQ